MRIEKIETIPVFIPFEATTRWHWGCREGANRLIVKLTTTDGIVGWGETTSGATQTIHTITPLILGEELCAIERILSKLQYLVMDNNSALEDAAVVEIAIWDALGKTLKLPVASLIGGKVRNAVPIALWTFFRYKGGNGVGGEETPDQVADFCLKRIKEHGFRTVKIKLGVMDPEVEIETIKAIRERIGSKINIRIDPNGAWTIGTALKVMRSIEDCGLEYIEDPVAYHDLEGMARLRSMFRTPLCANGSVHTHYQLAQVIRMKAADIVLSDVQMQGGIYNAKKLAAVAQAFGLGLSVHGSEYLGITMAAQLHFVSATPAITFACDAYYPHLTDDILVGGKLCCKDGEMFVPDGYGLGIEVDQERLAKYNRAYETTWQGLREKGKACPGYHPDFHNPGYIPVMSQW